MGCPVLDAAPALAVACALPAACPLVDLALLMVCPFVARALPVVCPFAAAARAPEAAFLALAVTRAPEAAFPAVAAFLALAAAPALKAACPALAAALAKLAIGRAQLEVRLNDGLGQTSTRRIRDIIIYNMCTVRAQGRANAFTPRGEQERTGTMCRYRCQTSNDTNKSCIPTLITSWGRAAKFGRCRVLDRA